MITQQLSVCLSDIEDDAKVQNEDDDDDDNGDDSNGKELQSKDVEMKDGNAEKATSPKADSRKRKAPENNEKGSPNKKVLYFYRVNAERFLKCGLRWRRKHQSPCQLFFRDVFWGC